MDLGGGSMNLLITYLKSIDDKRDSWKIRHTLVDIVLPNYSYLKQLRVNS